jgi:hypothetical protein
MMLMVETVPEDILKELQLLCVLHGQAICNHKKCREFSERLSDLLMTLEDMEVYRLADRLMSILLNCKPKEASHCEKANLVGERMKGITREMNQQAGK